MKQLLLLFCLSVGCAHAQTLAISDFSNFEVGSYSQSNQGAWSESTAQAGASTFTIGDFGSGVPSGSLGNGFVQWLGETPQDWSAYNFVTLTGFALPANATPKLNFYLEDSANGNNSAFTQFSLTAFSFGLNTVTVQLLPGAVDLSNVSYWGFTVSETNAPAFSFTFDQISLSVSAIPEPSTYAAMVGGLSLFATIVARRRRKVA